MRIDLPKNLSQKDLIEYLVKNKVDLIAKKKSMPVWADVCVTASSILPGQKGANGTKDNHPVDEDTDHLVVRVVANTANFIDSHMDMLIADSAKKSIEERMGMIPHLHDHIHRLDAKIGLVQDILLSDLSFTELGISDKFGQGSTQCIVFITDVMKEMNEKVFLQYKNGQVNQHSIGLQYISLALAVNNEDFKEEFAVWSEFIDLAINRNVAEKRGFFWVVKEIRLLENSAVLFGANPVTPTLDNNLEKAGPGNTTQHDGPSTDTHKNKWLL